MEIANNFFSGSFWADSPGAFSVFMRPGDIGTKETTWQYNKRELLCITL